MYATYETKAPRTVAELVKLLAEWPQDAALGHTDVNVLESPGVYRTIVCTNYYQDGTRDFYLYALTPRATPDNEQQDTAQFLLPGLKLGSTPAHDHRGSRR